MNFGNLAPWGHMWGSGAGWMWGGLMMVFWIGLAALIVWLAVRAASGTRTGFEDNDRARDVLAERYARGEISTEEYEERLAHLV